MKPMAAARRISAATAFVRFGLRDEAGHRGNHLPAIGPRVHLTHEAIDAIGVGVAHERRERRGRTATVGRVTAASAFRPTQKAEPSSP